MVEFMPFCTYISCSGAFAGMLLHMRYTITAPLQNEFNVKLKLFFIIKAGKYS